MMITMIIGDDDGQATIIKSEMHDGANDDDDDD